MLNVSGNVETKVSPCAKNRTKTVHLRTNDQGQREYRDKERDAFDFHGFSWRTCTVGLKTGSTRSRCCCNVGVLRRTEASAGTIQLASERLRFPFLPSWFLIGTSARPCVKVVARSQVVQYRQKSWAIFLEEWCQPPILTSWPIRSFTVPTDGNIFYVSLKRTAYRATSFPGSSPLRPGSPPRQEYRGYIHDVSESVRW